MPTLIYQASGSGDRRQCDAKCYNAKKPKCDCVCGGKNHGVGLNKALENSKEFLFGKPGELFKQEPGPSEIQEEKTL